MKFKFPLSLILLSGIFLLADRFLKWKALYSWTRMNLWGEYFGWDPFLNEGIAFGIILPTSFIFILTIAIIGAVMYLFYIHLQETGSEIYRRRALVGLTIVITGAVSNLVDRMAYGYTVDYLRIMNSVLNLADFFIISGFVLYFASLKHLK